MGKFYGAIGYAAQVESSPGNWTDEITERFYRGDVIRNVSKIREDQNLTDELNVDNRLSIIADPYAYTHFDTMRYVIWHGTKWKITSVDIQRPRLILMIGGVYNG